MLLVLCLWVGNLWLLFCAGGSIDSQVTRKSDEGMMDCLLPGRSAALALASARVPDGAYTF